MGSKTSERRSEQLVLHGGHRLRAGAEDREPVSIGSDATARTRGNRREVQRGGGRRKRCRVRQTRTDVQDPEAAIPCRVGHPDSARRARRTSNKRPVRSTRYSRPGDSRSLLRGRIRRRLRAARSSSSDRVRPHRRPRGCARQETIMNKLPTVVALIAVLSAPLVAHHGRGATYDMKKRVTLNGTVSRVEWRNPHVLIYMDVKDADGKVVTWGFENSGVSTLAQEGYNRNTLKVGQPITAIVNPAANGAPTAIVVKIILADGKEIMSRDNGQNPAN